MKIESYRPVSIEEVPNAPPEAQWITTYMEPVHAQIKTLTLALQANVGIDNMAVESRTVTMRDDQSVTIELQRIKGKPIGAVPIESSSAIDAFLVEALDVGKIKLTGLFQETAKDVTVKVLIFGA